MRTLREEIIACAEGQVRTLEAKGPQLRSIAIGRGSPTQNSALGSPSSDRGCELTFRPGDDFIGFRGHFPGHPVLPAFVQLLMAECAVRLHSGVPLSLHRVERGKFLRPIGPNEPVTVCWQEQPFSLTAEGGCPTKRCSFTLRVGAEKAAVFAVEFAAEEDQHA